MMLKDGYIDDLGDNYRLIETRELIYWSIKLVSYCIKHSDTELIFDVHDGCIEVMS